MSRETDTLSKEQRILIAMRKTLSRIVVETTPPAAHLQRVISDETVEQIKLCFDLISTRERELAELRGVTVTDRPYFTDEPPPSRPVSVVKLNNPDENKNDE